jgi:hypothetical protein
LFSRGHSNQALAIDSAKLIGIVERGEGRREKGVRRGGGGEE